MLLKLYNFILYKGDTGDLVTSDKYLNFKWLNPDCNILFSVTRQGKAAVCHFTFDKKGLRKLKQAANEWCEFCFWLFEWCKMIIGIIVKPSIARFVERCGFQYIGSFGNKRIYVRRP